jgi:hypothetical protein
MADVATAVAQSSWSGEPKVGSTKEYQSDTPTADAHQARARAMRTAGAKRVSRARE